MKIVSIQTEVREFIYDHPKLEKIYTDDNRLCLEHNIIINDTFRKVIYQEAFSVVTLTVKSKAKDERITKIISVNKGSKFKVDTQYKDDRIPDFRYFQFGVAIKEEIEKQFFPEEDVFDAPL